MQFNLKSGKKKHKNKEWQYNNLFLRQHKKLAKCNIMSTLMSYIAFMSIL